MKSLNISLKDDYASYQAIGRRACRQTLGDLLSRTAARVPDKLCLVYRQERLTYRQFDERVNQTAYALSNDGVCRGSMAAVLSRNSMDFAVLAFALARLGAVMVPINYMLNVSEIAYILQHAGIEFFFAGKEFTQRMDEASKEAGVAPTHLYLMDEERTPDTSIWRALGDVRADCCATPADATDPTQTTHPLDWEVYEEDVAQVLYTSGTESRPKGVMLTHRNLVAEYTSCIVEGRMEQRDVAIHALPLYHSAQLNCFLGPGIYVGASGVILEQAAPSIMLETIECEEVTQLFCPPTVWIALLRHPDFGVRNLSSLEKCYYGAAIMPMEVLKELSAKLPQAKFWNFYGQTEVAPLATALQPEDQLTKLGSAGKPCLNVETRIVDDDGNIVPRGTIGEIVHRTPHAMLGYLNDVEKTREAFKGGWFHSGDLGVMDEDGYITVVDRKKDMIKTGGVNVSSREVEEVIYEYPGVSEVAVIAVPDAYWIEVVTAVVVPKPGTSLRTSEIQAYCQARLAKFKVPKHIVLRENLPKNPSGKILKRELRETYSNRSEEQLS